MLLQLFPEAAAGFRDFLLRGMSPALADAITDTAASDQDVLDNLFELFAHFALQKYGQQIQQYR